MSSGEGSCAIVPSTGCSIYTFPGLHISRLSTVSPASRIFLALVGLLVFGVHNAAALTQKYCSSLNTGADFKPVVNIFQSHGACHDTCDSENYAFAIVQGNQCWCSNYAPGTTTSVGNCNDNCPGYPAEDCGSSTNDLYGYISLLRSPSGTIGGSSTLTSQVRTSPSPSTVTVSQTVTNLASVENSSNTPSSTHSGSTWIATPVTTVQTITGQVQTVTITPTSPAESTVLSSQQGDSGGFFSHAGRVAGLFVGLAMIILLAAAGALFVCWRRRRRNDGLLSPMADTNGSTLVRSRSRSISELGLVDGAEQGEKQSLPRITTGMWTMSGGSGGSPTGLSPASKRNSVARIVDQRLDPGAVWSPEHDNSSRISVRSLQDDRDYSRRVLRLANPDGK